MSFNRRRFIAATAATLATPAVVRAQAARETVIVTYPGRLAEPHRWLADRMESRHPGLRIRLVPSDSQDIVATIKAAQGYSPFDAMPNDEPPHLIAMSTLAIAAKSFGGSESKLDVGWEKLKELAPRAARSPAILTQMLEREEIAIAPLWNNNTAAAAEKGLTIRFLMPAPGAIAIISFFSAIARTQNSALVDEWLDGILSADYQARAAGGALFLRAHGQRRGGTRGGAAIHALDAGRSPRAANHRLACDHAPAWRPGRAVRPYFRPLTLSFGRCRRSGDAA